MALRSTIAALCAVASSGAAAAMTITSGDFKDGAALPIAQVYPRCGGQNVSPQLAWSGAPAGTRSFVLTMIDVSVKPSGWSHWIVAALPPQTRDLERGLKTLPPPARVAASNFGDPFYDGPCPPDGTGAHRYEFTIWAMPADDVAIAPNAKATDVIAMLQRTASDHATIAGIVTR